MAVRNIFKCDLTLACAMMAFIGINVSLQQHIPSQDDIWKHLDTDKLTQVEIEEYLRDLQNKGVEFIVSDFRTVGEKEPRKLGIADLLKKGELNGEDCRYGTLGNAAPSYAAGYSMRNGKSNAGIVKLATIYRDRIMKICHDKQIRVIESALAKIDSTNVQLVQDLADHYELVENDGVSARTASKTVAKLHNIEKTKVVEACEDFKKNFPVEEITKNSWGSTFRDESILKWQFVLGVCHSLISPVIKSKTHPSQVFGLLPFVTGMAGFQLLNKLGG